jgi:hypothetical protein
MKWEVQMYVDETDDWTSNVAYGMYDFFKISVLEPFKSVLF